jgi:hypothetical protein
LEEIEISERENILGKDDALRYYKDTLVPVVGLLGTSLIWIDTGTQGCK